jgi:hypothetical protein
VLCLGISGFCEETAERKEQESFSTAAATFDGHGRSSSVKQKKALPGTAL